jgi:hypothetical protein
VTDIEISFSADQEAGKLGMSVCKKLESKDNSTVRRIFKGDDAECCFSGLNSFEDICDSLRLD